MEATAGRDVVPTLVLCCAKDTRHLLPPALELLVGRGFQVEVVSGLEQRDDAVLVTAQRQRDAVYILFESAELGRPLLDRTRAKLIGAGVPVARIACMPLDWRGPLDVVKRVESMGLAGVPTVRRPTAVGLPSIATTPGSVASIPPPLPRTTSERNPLLSGSVPVLDGSDDAEIVGFGHARRRLMVGTGVALGSLALIFTIVAIVSDDEPEPTASTVATASPDPSVEAAWSWLEEARDGTAKPAVPAEPTTSAAAAPVPPAAAPLVVEPVVVEPVARGSEGTEPAAPELVFQPAAVAQPQPVAPAVTPPPPPIAPALTPAAAAEVPSEEPKIEEVAEIDEAEMQSIYAGLIAQKFRALDILLIAPEPRKRLKKKYSSKTPARMSWGQAAAYCEGLEIAGVSDWRLPRVGELGSITVGSLIADGKFWSQTEGDTFGKSRVVWNTQTSKMGSAPVKWKGGRVVCVRTMARPPELPDAAADK